MTRQTDTERLLRQLVETPAGERIRMKCGAADLRSVITDALSLVDSKANMARELALIVDVGTSDDPGTALAKIRRLQESAATAMRDACVEKVGQILTGLMIELSQTPDSYLRGQGWNSALARANNEIMPALQSLTLDNCES